jgi:hypothetical protein
MCPEMTGNTFPSRVPSAYYGVSGHFEGYTGRAGRTAKPCTSVRLRAQPPFNSSKVGKLSISQVKHVSIAYPYEYPELVG